MPDDDTTDWQPGAPAPWLADYGPGPATPPIDPAGDGTGVAGAPPLPPVLPPPQPGLGMPAAVVDQAAAAMQPPAFVPPAPDVLAGMPPPLPPPTPDAITGVAGAAPESEARNAKQDLAQIAKQRADSNAQIAVDPRASLSDRQAAWQALPPDMRANIVNSADPKQLAAIATSAMAPEDLATIAVRHQQAQLHEESAQRLKLAQQADEDARAAFQAHQAAVQHANDSTNQLAIDAQQLSQQKIDPAEHGVGHFIASVLTSALGGAMSQYTGGRNLALEELDKQTQRRIDAQKANLANQWQGVNFKRNLVAEQLQQSGDLYRAQETYRISQYDRAIGELQTKMQDYDPQGTTALRSAQTVQQVQAQRGAALQAFAQQTFKNKIDAAKVQLDNQKAAQDAADKAAQRALERENSQRSTWATTRGQDLSLQEKRIEAQDKKDERAATLATQANGGAIGGVATGVDAQGNVQYGTLTNADGKPLVIKDDKLHNEITGMISGADEVNRLSNQLAREIKDWGGQSDTVKGAKWQKIQADKEALVDAIRNAKGIARLAPGVVEELDKLTAGVDPTSFIRTATPGILRARDNINQAIDTELRRRANYTGPKYQPADTSELPPPSNDEWDEIETNLKSDPTRLNYEDSSELDRQFISSATGGNQANNPASYDRALVQLDPAQLDPAQRAQVDAIDPTLREAYRTGMSPSQLQNFRSLQDAVTSGDVEAKKRATAILKKLAGDGGLQPAYRAIAGRILLEGAGHDVPIPSDVETEPDTAVPREATPPARSR